MNRAPVSVCSQAEQSLKLSLSSHCAHTCALRTFEEVLPGLVPVVSVFGREHTHLVLGGVGGGADDVTDLLLQVVPWSNLECAVRTGVQHLQLEELGMGRGGEERGRGRGGVEEGERGGGRKWNVINKYRTSII